MQVSRGSLYLRGQTWTINYTVGGRRMREAIGTNKKLAEMVLNKRITEAIENRWFDKRNVGVMPFSEFAEIYINRHVAMLKSIKAERISVQNTSKGRSDAGLSRIWDWGTTGWIKRSLFPLLRKQSPVKHQRSR
jgi:hypothetical protein